MAKNEVPLSLVIRAVDQATAPLRAINQKINAYTAPVRKLNNSFRALSKEAGLGKLIDGFKGVGSAVGNVVEQAAGLGLKIAGMAIGAGFALYHIAKSAIDAGDKLSEMAQRVGLGVNAYAQLQFAAEQSDISQEDFNSGLDQFNVRMGELKGGTGPLLAALEKWGPGLGVALKGTKDNEQALNKMIKAMVLVKDPAKRAALAQAAFGKGGKQFGQFLGQGGKAIDALRARYLALAGDQQEFADRASVADNAVRETETAFLGLRNALATGLFPALTKIATALANVLSKNRDGLRKWAEETGAAIVAWVEGGGIERLVSGLRELVKGAGEVIDKVGGFKNVLIGVGAIMAGPLIGSVVSLAGSLLNLGITVLPILFRGLLLLGPVLEGVAVACAAMGAPFLLVAAAVVALGVAGYEVYKNWQPIKELFADIAYNVNLLVGKITGLGGEGSFRSLSGEYNARPAFQGLPESSKRNYLGATPPGAPGSTEAKVTVDFQNMPKGTRVTQAADSETDVNLFMGYASVLSQ